MTTIARIAAAWRAAKTQWDADGDAPLDIQLFVDGRRVGDLTQKVAADTLPENGVGDAEVRAHQYDHVGGLEVRVGVGRRVEPKGLLVGDDRGRHEEASKSA